MNIETGLLLIGVTNTILLDGQGAIELLFINAGNGEEVALPVTEEQAEFLLSQVDVGGEASDGEVESNKQVQIAGGASTSAWKETDKTPQL